MKLKRDLCMLTLICTIFGFTVSETNNIRTYEVLAAPPKPPVDIPTYVIENVSLIDADKTFFEGDLVDNKMFKGKVNPNLEFDVLPHSFSFNSYPGDNRFAPYTLRAQLARGENELKFVYYNTVSNSPGYSYILNGQEKAIKYNRLQKIKSLSEINSNDTYCFGTTIGDYTFLVDKAMTSVNAGTPTSMSGSDLLYDLVIKNTLNENETDYLLIGDELKSNLLNFKFSNIDDSEPNLLKNVKIYSDNAWLYYYKNSQDLFEQVINTVYFDGYAFGHSDTSNFNITYESNNFKITGAGDWTTLFAHATNDYYCGAKMDITSNYQDSTNLSIYKFQNETTAEDVATDFNNNIDLYCNGGIDPTITGDNSVSSTWATAAEQYSQLSYEEKAKFNASSGSSSSEITDLTGYTWVPNDSISWPGKITYNIKATLYSENGKEDTTETLEFITKGSGPDSVELLQISSDAYYANYMYVNSIYQLPNIKGIHDGTSDDPFKQMTFTGGTDATNATLITWLQANGTLTKPTQEIDPAIEEMLSKYDYIYGKYGSTIGEDFLRRFSNYDPTAQGNKSKILNIKDINNSTWIIAVVSIIGLTSVGAYFFYRKRKEE